MTNAPRADSSYHSSKSRQGSHRQHSTGVSIGFETAFPAYLPPEFAKRRAKGILRVWSVTLEEMKKQLIEAVEELGRVAKEGEAVDGEFKAVQKEVNTWRGMVEDVENYLDGVRMLMGEEGAGKCDEKEKVGVEGDEKGEAVRKGVRWESTTEGREVERKLNGENMAGETPRDIKTCDADLHE